MQQDYPGGEDQPQRDPQDPYTGDERAPARDPMSGDQPIPQRDPMTGGQRAPQQDPNWDPDQNPNQGPVWNPSQNLDPNDPDVGGEGMPGSAPYTDDTRQGSGSGTAHTDPDDPFNPRGPNNPDAPINPDDPGGPAWPDPRGPMEQAEDRPGGEGPMEQARDRPGGEGAMEQAEDARHLAPDQTSDDPYLDGNPDPTDEPLYGDSDSGQVNDQ